jgi:hypothetical protein
MNWTVRCNYPDCGFLAIKPSLDDAERALTRHDFRRHQAVAEAVAYLVTPHPSERPASRCSCLLGLADPFCPAHVAQRV